jgi:4-carboxymuconolactone decarboxylase
MPYHLNLALDNGVKPKEISEIITHLAFYSGWGNALSAVAVAKEIFMKRNIGADQLPPASPKLLPIEKAAEDRRVIDYCAARNIKADIELVGPSEINKAFDRVVK